MMEILLGSVVGLALGIGIGLAIGLILCEIIWLIRKLKEEDY